ELEISCPHMLTEFSLPADVVQEEFEEHAEKAKTLPDTTTNESKLCLYGLYKQATVGPVNTAPCGCEHHQTHACANSGETRLQPNPRRRPWRTTSPR
uniref:ACB domain-containing protein n=1 Tax=Aegilops tauschii subsp. strangulata TaxID=200361 RepID=A0A453QGA2_AEGTS